MTPLRLAREKNAHFVISLCSAEVDNKPVYDKDARYCLGSGSHDP